MSRNPYIRTVSNYTWWTVRRRYVRYMLREASCIFIGAYTGVLVIGLVQLARGPESWNSFVAALQSPVSLCFNLLTLGFALYHSVTWFGVTPKAMPLRIGVSRVPASAIVGVHYLGWAVFSVLFLWWAGGGA